MTLKKSGFLKIIAILLLSLICAAAAIVAPNAAYAQSEPNAENDPYAMPEGSEALITYERYQTSSVVGFQYTLCLGNEHKSPELLAKAAELLNEDYSGTGWTAEADKDGETLYLSLAFDTLTDYYIAAGITGFDPPDDDGAEGITSETSAFYVYTTNETETVFAQKENTPVASLEIVAATCGVPEDRISYKYFYATKYKKAFTSNAERVLEYPDFNLHVFDIPRDNLGRKISITSRNPNPDSWYLIAIGIGTLVAIATGIAIFMNYRKKKED